MTEAVIVFLCQFAYIMLLGLQQLNVVGKHYASAAGTSFALGWFGYFLTATVAVHEKHGMYSMVWWAFVSAGPIGIVVSMWLHPRLKRLWRVGE